MDTKTGRAFNLRTTAAGVGLGLLAGGVVAVGLAGGDGGDPETRRISAEVAETTTTTAAPETTTTTTAAPETTVIVEAPADGGGGGSAPAPAPLEDRVGSLETRVDALEEAPPTTAAPEPTPNPTPTTVGGPPTTTDLGPGGDAGAGL